MKKHLPLFSASSFFIILFLFGFSHQSFSQSFAGTNGRNHPELDWVRTESEHFVVVFPRHLDGIQHEAHTVAELTYEALSKTLDVTFDDKIRIYLSDEDEIANGFAVPFRPYYTDIWVNTNDWADGWTGNEKWMRKVLAHELAHLFQFEMTRTNIGLWNVVFNDPMPRHWSEGFAQYQTEKWDAARGERWLRKAVFDDNLSWGNPNALDNGRLIYAAGNSQLRFFNETYGDSSFNKLTNYRDTVLKYFQVHNFEDAFEETMDFKYSQFVDQWKKHLNIYYNTLAGQVDRIDSLDSKEVKLPGQFYFDADYSSTGDSLVVLSLESMERPVFTLYLLEKEAKKKKKSEKDSTANATDSVKYEIKKTNLLTAEFLSHVRLSNDGKWVVYAREIRGKHGSIIPDVFRIHTKTKKIERITKDRRASFPVFDKKDEGIYFIAMEKGTANVFHHNISSGDEKKISNFTGSNELTGLEISPDGKYLVISQFDKDAQRNLILLNLETGKMEILDAPLVDNKRPRFSPDGKNLFYMSLRDDVPNIFVMDLESREERRVTWQFTGAEILAIKPDTTAQLLISASEDRNRDYAFLISSERTARNYSPTVPDDYSAWTTHEPPNMIDYQPKINTGLASEIQPHKPIKDITHLLSFGLPIWDETTFGAFGFTNWSDPLGKHTFNLAFQLTTGDFNNSSFWLASYQNNTFYPNITFSTYKIPSRGQFVEDQFIIEDFVGGDISTSWPLNLSNSSFTKATIFTRNRYARFRPFDSGITGNGDVIATDAIQADMEIALILRRQKPYRNSAYHALDGSGLRISFIGAAPMLSATTEFVRSDISAFTIVPIVGKINMLFHARNQVQWGTSLAQDFVGFSRYDNIRFSGLPIETLFFANVERVRGFREFATGDQATFASTELRIPLLKGLETSVLGIVEVGGISVAAFADYGLVGDRGFADNANRQEFYSTGWEIKNAMILFGGLELSHAFGAGYPKAVLFDGSPVYHYRIRGTIPF